LFARLIELLPRHDRFSETLFGPIGLFKQLAASPSSVVDHLSCRRNIDMEQQMGIVRYGLPRCAVDSLEPIRFVAETWRTTRGSAAQVLFSLMFRVSYCKASAGGWEKSIEVFGRGILTAPHKLNLVLPVPRFSRGLRSMISCPVPAAITIIATVLIYLGHTYCTELACSPFQSVYAACGHRIGKYSDSRASMPLHVDDSAQQNQIAPPFVALPLMRVDSISVWKQLVARFPREGNVEFVVDEASNTIFIRASAKVTQQAKQFVQQLDVDSHLMVVRLKYIPTTWIAKLLSLVLGTGSRITIRADLRENTLIITAPEPIILEMETILQQFHLLQRYVGFGSRSFSG